MADELLNQYIDPQAIIADTDFLIKELERAKAAFDALNKVRINITPDKPLTDISAGIQAATKATNDFTTAQVGLTNAVKEKIVVNSKEYQALLAEVEAKKQNSKATQEGATAETETIKTKKELTKAEVEQRLAAQQRLAALKQEIILEQASQGSINQKKVLLASLQKSYDALSESQRSSGDGDGLLKDIAALDKELKSLEGDTGRFQRNVGNYASAFSGRFADAFAVLTRELELVRQKIAAVDTTAGDTSGLEKLKKEESLLSTITYGLGQSFTTPTAELRAFTNAAKDIGQEFGIASDTFNEFVQEVGSKKDELQDIQATINFQASDTKYLDGIVSAVSGIAGAYGVAQSAQQLFGDGDEELQKQMVKLQAILTLVTSLQSVLNAVQTESGAVQVGLAAKTGLLNAARKLQAFLTGAVATSEQEVAAATIEETASAQAASVALAEQSIATQAGTVANTEFAAGAGAVDAALIAEAGAADVATTATSTFATTLIATGIGAIVVAIAAGVVYLVSKMQDWNAANASLIKSNEALSNSLTDLVSATKEYESIRSLAAQKELKDLENLIEQRKASGVTAGQSLALDKKIAEQKLKTANQDAQLYGITVDLSKKLQAIAKQDAAVVILAEKQKREFLKETAKEGNKDYEDRLKQLETSITLRKEEAAASKAQFDFANDIIQKQGETSSQIDLLNTQEAKLNADERRKLILESARIESDIITTKNSFILANEKSTLAERLAAIKSNAEQQRKVIQAELNNVINDPSTSATDRNLAKKKAAADQLKVTLETNKAVFDTDESYRKRKLKAELDFDTAVLDTDKEFQDKLAANEFASTETRINAVIESVRDQKAKLEAAKKFTIETTVLTNEELIALNADYAAKSLSIDRAAAVQKKAIQEKAKSDRLEILKSEQKEALENQLSVDINALQRGFDNGLISQREYNHKRLELEYDFARDSLQIEIEAAKKQLELIQLTDVQRSKIEYDLAKLERELSDASLKHFKDNEKEKVAAALDTLGQIQKTASDVFGLIDGILNANAISQKNILDAQQEAAEKKASRDIEIVNASALAEQDKAAKILVINARLAAQKEQIARKEKQTELDRARFQKAENIFSIILNTAQAVIKQLATTPLPYGAPFVAAVAALGAAQLAIAIATPIPKYRHGKNLDNYEGPAYVNDGIHDEVIERADGSLEFPQGRNVLTHVGKNDIIHPDKDAWLNAILNAAHRDASAGMKVTHSGDGGARMLNMALEKQTKSIVSAIRNKREITIKGVSGRDLIFKDGNNSTAYLNNNLQG